MRLTRNNVGLERIKTMKTDRFINAVSRAFWRRIEPYKNDFERELPEELPVQFRSFMGTALSWLEDKVLVWNDTPCEPKDNALCLVHLHNGEYQVGCYNDVQKVFALTTGGFKYLPNIKRWAELDC